MNALQIDAILARGYCSRRIFAGTYSVDTLPNAKITKRPWCCCLNLSPSTEPGSHWVAIYLKEDADDDDDKDNNAGNGEFFCSYGTNPEDLNIMNLTRFVTRNNVNRYNNMSLQNVFSSLCGEYVIGYLLVRCKGYRLFDLQHCFTNNSIINDKIIVRFWNRLIA